MGSEMQKEQGTHELIERIRAHINRRKKQAKLLVDRSKWLKLTSSLDVLADTASAIEYYLEANYPNELGNKYLHTYGLLQCIMMQQDAAEGISISLLDKNLKFEKDYPEAYLVREMRNDVAGHPTNRDNGKAFIYLVQHSLSKECFTYLKSISSDDFQSELKNVDVMRAITQTVLCVNDVLKRTADHLDNEFRDYKDEHKQRKMASIFTGLEYAAEKVLLKDAIFMSTGYQETKRMVRECEIELMIRYGSVDTFDAFAYILEKIKTTHDLIDNGFCDLPSETQTKVKDCLHEFLFDRLNELKQLCIETDEEFESE